MFSNEDKKKNIATPRICDVVWHDGEFIAWNDARVHVMSHVLHYGSSIFEGIRCYATKQGPAVFRLKEHMQRFLNSAKTSRFITSSIGKSGRRVSPTLKAKLRHLIMLGSWQNSP